MDIKELLKKGLYKDLSYNDLWELEQDAEDLAAYISQDAALAAAIGNFRTYVARRNMDLQTLEIRPVSYTHLIPLRLPSILSAASLTC